MANTKPTSAPLTFAVDPVSASPKVLPTEKVHVSIAKLLGGPIEACDTYHVDVVQQPGFHSLVGAAHLAYQYHCPLVLSPDVIWLTLAQGLASHVNNHADDLRPRLVPHLDKTLIMVRRDDFVKGSPENSWTEIWPEFSTAIKKALGPENYSRILSDFSTTGPTERAASEVVLMDCVQSYFRYEFHTRCGIPAITLEGKVEDWEKIQQRVDWLDQFGLSWWTKDVRQITIEFVRAAQGHPNKEFWQALYKQHNASGGPYMSGWLVRLLPYLKHREYRLAQKDDCRSGYCTPWQTDLRNPWVGKPLLKKPGLFEGITDSQLPSSASQVPFVWDYLKSRYDYQFLAGVLTVEQHPETQALRPRVGWAVRQAPKAK